MNSGRISPLFERRGMITKKDHERINDLISRHQLISKIDVLEKKLQLYTLIESNYVPRYLVTMNSELLVSHLNTGETFEVKLVYQHSPLNKNQVSVLAPLGTALLGLTENETVRYLGRDGRERQITVRKIIFQPEAANLDL